MAWKDSEDKTKIFLDKKISQWAKNNPEFEKIHTNSKGGSDSTQPDIEIFKKNKIIFNIEIKEDNSQIGQFVIIPDNSSKKFVLGDIKGNKSRTAKINEYMNKNFDNYNKPTTAGLVLRCSDKIIYDCIKNFLEEKNNRYIACKIKETIKIIHYKKFSDFFSAKAIYRKKKSGSSPVSSKSIIDLKKYVKDEFNAVDVKFIKNKKFFFKSQAKNLLGKYFLLDDDKYFISKKKYGDLYRITKTSKTNNPNVIFVISMKDKNKKDNIDLLKKDLLEND